MSLSLLTQKIRPFSRFEGAESVRAFTKKLCLGLGKALNFGRRKESLERRRRVYHMKALE
jgi:hypothetical protein